MDVTRHGCFVHSPVGETGQAITLVGDAPATLVGSGEDVDLAGPSCMKSPMSSCYVTTDSAPLDSIS